MDEMIRTGERELVIRQREFFLRAGTKDVEYRKAQLRNLKRAIQRYENRMYQAIHQDFAKSEFETFATELALLYKEIDIALKKVGKWSRPKRVPTDLPNLPGRSMRYPEPLGVSLVIGAWNYPYLLSLMPVVAAIAAGNTVVLKPSELPARTSEVMRQMVEENFPPEYFTVVEGGVEPTTRLLEQRWDKIFFTGSPRVGQVVYEAAAKHLTPVSLELGGKSPAIVMPDANIDVTARRLVWAKFLNAGQTCVAPDYILAHESIKDRLIQAMVRQIEKSDFQLKNDNYVRIINSRNVDRLQRLINPAKVVHGGQVDVEERVIRPTILDGVSWTDEVMQEEIFGPILPVLSFHDFQEALDGVKSLPRPLSCYLYSKSSATRKEMLRQISFGGGAVNESLMHLANPNLPFGGVGQSGIGAYGGKAGFDAFTHYRSVLIKPFWGELPVRYAPYSARKLRWVRRLFGG